jgi:hypothetical protein
MVDKGHRSWHRLEALREQMHISAEVMAPVQEG